VTASTVDQVIDALLDTLRTHSTEGLAALASPDFVQWNTVDLQERSLDELARTLRWQRDQVPDVSVRVHKRLLTIEGAVLALQLQGATRGGEPYRVDACLVLTVEDGLLIRVDEYLNAAQVAVLLEG
jgi:ketosteroid isomerase-like protein